MVYATEMFVFIIHANNVKILLYTVNLIVLLKNVINKPLPSISFAQIRFMNASFLMHSYILRNILPTRYMSISQTVC